MNKHIIKAVLSAVLAAPLFTSCELDQFPEGTLPIEKSWETVADAANYNVGILANLRGVNGGAYAMIPEVQADLFNATLCNGNPPYSNIQDWTFTESGFAGDGFWSGNYGMISNTNNVINNIDKVINNVKANPDAGIDDKLAELDSYKATAYFARAYAYTTLATYYCKDYEPETAEQTLGLPLVTTVSVTDKPGRSSLAATFALIKSDIAKAKELFVNKTNTAIDAPTYYTTLALEARVALMTHDYATAIAAADELIGSGSFPLIKKGREFSNMWLNDEGTEIIYEPQQNLDERPNAFDAFISITNTADGQMYYTPKYIPTQGLLDLYGAGDYRKDVYFAPLGVYVNESSFARGAYVLSKYPGNPALDKGTSAKEFHNMTKVFRIAEMYLIKAEAEYRQSGAGLATLNELRKARGAAEFESTGVQLLQDIKDEWAREMVGEGQRLACLKRWNQGMKRMAPQNLVDGVLYPHNNTTSLQKSADDKRFVWEICSNDLTANSNLERNWPKD